MLVIYLYSNCHLVSFSFSLKDLFLIFCTVLTCWWCILLDFICMKQYLLSFLKDLCLKIELKWTGFHFFQCCEHVAPLSPGWTVAAERSVLAFFLCSYLQRPHRPPPFLLVAFRFSLNCCFLVIWLWGTWCNFLHISSA